MDCCLWNEGMLFRARGAGLLCARPFKDDPLLPCLASKPPGPRPALRLMSRASPTLIWDMPARVHSHSND